MADQGTTTVIPAVPKSDPGDHPGYLFMTLTGDDTTDTALVNQLANQGYRVVNYGFAPMRLIMSRGY
jgi:hypothetical protein